jgi:hypothetical protein
MIIDIHPLAEMTEGREENAGILRFSLGFTARLACMEKLAHLMIAATSPLLMS